MKITHNGDLDSLRAAAIAEVNSTAGVLMSAQTPTWLVRVYQAKEAEARKLKATPPGQRKKEDSPLIEMEVLLRGKMEDDVADSIIAAAESSKASEVGIEAARMAAIAGIRSETTAAGISGIVEGFMIIPKRNDKTPAAQMLKKGKK